MLPLQYGIVATEHFDLFTVFIPVYVFLAIPLVSAFGNDPTRFLERTAKIQWGIMVCVYGMSHAPALLLLDLPRYEGAAPSGAVPGAGGGQRADRAGGGEPLAAPPPGGARDQPLVLVARLVAGRAAAGIVGAALYWATPFKPIPALVMGFIAGGAGTFGEFVMKALKKDAGVRSWGGRPRCHAGRRRPARPRGAAVLRRAGVLPFGALVLQPALIA